MDAASDPRFDFVADAQRVKPSQPGNAYGDVSSKAARNGATSQELRGACIRLPLQVKVR